MFDSCSTIKVYDDVADLVTPPPFLFSGGIRSTLFCFADISKNKRLGNPECGRAKKKKVADIAARVLVFEDIET